MKCADMGRHRGKEGRCAKPTIEPPKRIRLAGEHGDDLAVDGTSTCEAHAQVLSDIPVDRRCIDARCGETEFVVG
jgi:hypothetical protein